MPNIKEKKQKRLSHILPYLYLFVGFSYIIYYISYTIRITNKIEGWALMMFIALLYFIAYVAINHILIKRILPIKLLIVIEALLFISILTLVISDWNFEHYLYLKYLHQNLPATSLPR